MQKLKWDFDGFSVLASAKFDSKLIFKGECVMGWSYFDRDSFGLPQIFILVYRQHGIYIK